MNVYTNHKPAGGTDGLFLDLKDGERARIRVASEPAISSNEFKDPDTGEITLTTRYSWVVWNRDEKRPQVLSKGASVFKQFAALVEDWDEPTQYDATIKREGTMLATRWTVTPSPKSEPLTKEEQAECDKVDLLKAVKGNWLRDFEDGGEQAAPLEDDAPPMGDGYAPINIEDIPF
jgi:hypothetical protein